MYKDLTMRFLLRRDFSGKNLFGMDVTIPADTYLESDDKYILYKKLPLCVLRSEIAKRYFIWADDGFEQTRLAYENIILFASREKSWTVRIPVTDDNGNIISYETVTMSGRFSPAEVSYIKASFPHLVTNDQTLLFNDFFYVGSNIEDLEKIAKYLSK